MLAHEIIKNRRALNVYASTDLLHYEDEESEKSAKISSISCKRSVRKALVLNLVEEFGKQTTIHGLNHVFACRANTAQRLLWTLIFLAVLGSLIYVSLFLAHRHNERIFETIVENTNYPIYKIQFPEITICNNNRLNWARFEAAKQQFLLPEHRTAEYEQLFTEVVTLYDTLTFGDFEAFERLADKPLKTLNYINFTTVVNLMAWHCDELLTNCAWRQIEMNCCQIFIPRKSQLGQCWAFNSIESQYGALKQFLDPLWPWHASTPGQGSGLKVRVLINEHQHSPFSWNEKGLTFMAVEPGVWYYHPISLNKNTNTRVLFDGRINFYDNQTKRLPSSVRQCVFKDELNSFDYKSLQDHKYMFENCRSQCQQEYLLKFCNCTTDLFFPASQYPICKLVDLPCLAKYGDELVRFKFPGQETFLDKKLPGIDCHCFLNCFSLRYLTDVRTRGLRKEEFMENNSFVDMDFYFVRNFITAYRTKLIYTWVDLMVSFGGITALFLGCSLISIVELIYFLLVDIPKRVRKTQANIEQLDTASAAEEYETLGATRRKVKKLQKY